MEDEDEHGHDHAHDHQVNEHFWLSVALYRVQVQNIAEQLAAADGEHASAYLANAARYDKELAALEADLHAELDRYSGRKIITFHDAFPYFARDYNFEVVATITNDPNTEISPQHIKRLVDIIKATPDIILFTEKEYPSPVAEVLERETGVKSYMIDSAVSGNNALNSYIEAMRSNGKIVSEAMAAGTAQ
jgi:zinc transport system substrate-binding protein